MRLYKALLPRRYQRYLRRAGGDSDKCHEALLHGTFYEEYDAYDFAHKCEEERRSYLTDAVRNRLCRRVNDSREQRVVMDKCLCAERLADRFGRRFVAVDDGHGDDFVRLGVELGELVVKPAVGCAGRGVELLSGTTEAHWREYLGRLNQGRWIAEERISQHPFMSRWNASVNTVRFNTFNSGGKVRGFTAFLRTGRAGSFVDNGAQGGIFAAIDDANGLIISHAHELRALACELALRFPRLTYIGWDFALTPSGWIPVEANKGEFIAQQICLGRGLRGEFEMHCGLR